GANDSLFSNTQGMGEVNLGAAFDGVGRILHDQITGEKFTATGQTRTYAGTIVDSTKPFRVTLAWSDAPGNTSGNAFNNNLDLTVSIGGNTYKGNVFSGQYSSPGGAADTRNNVESVFLPVGTSGNFLVTITAANINSDGVPNEAPSLDQDYALVVYNAALAAGPAIIGDSATLTAENCSPYNGTPDPGETVTYNFSLRNIGTTDATNLTVALLATNGVSNPSAPQTYGRIVAGGPAVTNSFTFIAIGACGDTLLPTLQLQDGGTDLGTASFGLQMGQFAGFASENFDSVVTPALPAGWTTTASGAQSKWVTTTVSSDSAPNSVFCPDPTAVGLAELTSPVFNLPQGPAQLSFRHSYYLESGFDGGVLEISINGGPFTDV
ncbi:MAG: S8 family serine peptidase, partial [Limisphaerales bacterium]